MTRKTMCWFACAGAVALLASCSGSELAQTRGLETQGTHFENALYRGYLDRSEHEYNYGDYRSSDVFATRAQDAAAGQVVLPFELNEPYVQSHGESRAALDSKTPELREARGDLMDVLRRSARDKAPEAAARAQVMFDCWMEEGQPSHIAACRDGFRMALGEAQAAVAEPAAAPAPEEPQAVEPQQFTIYFAFDDATVRPGEMSDIDEVADLVQDEPDLELSVTGHADRAGPVDYNQALSLRRAEAVRDVLLNQGLDDTRISIAARGESEPAVATPDGVPEQANRRVVIIVQ